MLRKKIRKIGVFSLAIANATLAELYFGAFNSKKVEGNLKRISVFKKHLTVYPDSEESAKIFGKFKSRLKSEGDIIEDFDILIASIAFVNNCILVTNNPKHFQRIQELRIENWKP
ncbi:MAG: PIN domain-containing protein [Chrysiogenales bacterium]